MTELVLCATVEQLRKQPVNSYKEPCSNCGVECWRSVEAAKAIPKEAKVVCENCMLKAVLGEREIDAVVLPQVVQDLRNFGWDDEKILNQIVRFAEQFAEKVEDLDTDKRCI